MAASPLVTSPFPVQGAGPSMASHYSFKLSSEQKPIEVYVATVGEESPMVPLLMEVSKVDTIASVKLRIQAHRGFYVDQQRLVYGGKELAKDESLLQDYGVSHGDVLHLVLRTRDLVSLTLRTVNGNSFVYKVWELETSRDLLKSVTDKERGSALAIPVVILQGEQVEDAAIVEELSVKGESVLLLRVHKAKVRSQILGRKELELDISSLNDIPVQNSALSVLSFDTIRSEEGLSFRNDPLGKEDQQLQHLRHGLQQQARISLPFKYPISFDLPNALKELVDHVRMGLHAGQSPKLTTEGSGGVYLMKDECGLQNVAVFKPMDEEPMTVNNPRGFSMSNYGEGLKKGTRSGEGAIREVAAYVLDHPAGGARSRTRGDMAKRAIRGFSGVPPTTMVNCYHEAFHYGSDDHRVWKAKKGSLQQFVDAVSSCEDMGSSMFSVGEVHKITVLDLRLANTDRNGGNILVCKGNDGKLELVPIDHGYCLPDKFEDCSFEWLYWPQAEQPYAPSTLEYIESLDAEEDLALLRQCGWTLPARHARVFRVSTMVLKKGAAAGLSPFQIGSIMSRVESLDRKSPIELILEKAESIHLRGREFLKVVENLLDEYIASV